MEASQGPAKLQPKRTIQSPDDVTWFWSIIDATRGTDEDDQLGKLGGSLRELADQDLVDFIHLFNGMRNRMYSWRLWAAAYLINGGCSDDGFIDFRNWLIARGRREAEEAMRDPDSLAGHDIEMDCASFEQFGYVMLEVFRERSDGAYPSLPGEAGGGQPSDPDWDFDFDDEAEMQRRLPRLSAEFAF